MPWRLLTSSTEGAAGSSAIQGDVTYLMVQPFELAATANVTDLPAICAASNVA
jgi:hypothetical protein